MKVKIGDIVQYLKDKDVWEVIGFNNLGTPKCKCVDIGESPYSIGRVMYWNIYEKIWVNLSQKSKNFNSLYNKLDNREVDGE